MTNEIKKLYKNVGLDNLWVERYTDGNGFEHENWYPSYKVMIKSMMEKNDWTLKEAQNVAKKECHKELLPFTAEKQLELIKWLGHRRRLDISIHNIKGCTIYDISNDYDCIVDEHKFMFDSNTFEDALAGLINQVWHSLTPEEKQQIKEILK